MEDMTDRSMEDKEVTAASENLGNGDINNQLVENEDPELEKIKARVKELKMIKASAEELLEESKRIKRLQIEADIMAYKAPANLSLSIKEKMEIDARSIYVGNVDYGATVEELEAHFHGCGSINRITIQCDKFSNRPKGFAYIEFADADSVSTSTALDESLFRGRQIKILPKRTNRPGISSTNRPPRKRFHKPSRPHFRVHHRYTPTRRSYRQRSGYYPY